MGQAKAALTHSSAWGGSQRGSTPAAGAAARRAPRGSRMICFHRCPIPFWRYTRGRFFNFPIELALCPASPNGWFYARGACFLRNLERARYCGRKRRFPLVHFSRMNGILGCNRKIRFCLTNAPALCYNTKAIPGEMSEWFMEPVLKTGDAARHRGFESLSLRQI